MKRSALLKLVGAAILAPAIPLPAKAVLEPDIFTSVTYGIDLADMRNPVLTLTMMREAFEQIAREPYRVRYYSTSQGLMPT